MGVPAFYRWLSEKYPKIVEDVLEERVKLASPEGSVRVPFDATRPNPSGLETDNLYVDMNGIIHPCSHPEHGPQPATEQEMYENVCRYVDRLFRAVRPRKLLYLAIDGVAPRAKMNQQRSRRFRSAQEAREHEEIEQHIRNELVEMGEKVPPPHKTWDSNVITPGTTFMLNLSDYIRFYIRKRIATDKAWQQIQVIFSDASIPGEGEHKIMNHIRLQRSQPGYCPNNVHVLHGLDADLIMLALATHEMHFYILREVVVFGRKGQDQLEQRQLESGFTDAQRRLDEEAGSEAMELVENKQKQLQRVSIPTLRDYLANEFASCCTPGQLPFPVSLERLIDDIVFLCFFVGNDFLPHLPSLDIRDGALDYLFNVYKRILPTLGDYITNHGGQVNLSHVDVILAEVGAIEDYVFSMKHQNEERQKRFKEQRRNQQKRGGPSRNPEAPPVVATTTTTAPPKTLGRAARILEKRQKQQQPQHELPVVQDDPSEPVVALGRGHMAKEEHRKHLKEKHMPLAENARAAMELKKSLMGDSKESQEPDVTETVETEGAKTEDIVASGTKRKADDLVGEDAAEEEEVVAGGDGEDVEEEEEGDDEDDDEEEDVDATSQEEDTTEADAAAAAKVLKEKIKAAKDKQLDEYSKNVEDKVRLHEAGWKDRYYKDKCKADDVSAHGGREHLFRSYVMGLCWVMKYYYDGCPSWKWYYPFHYAPFASDLRNIERFEKDCKSFELSEPFKPVEQLMAVLPSDSSHAIPKASRWYMTDEESPIIDFYPKDVPCDPNGKAMPWLWVVLLPFIDEERLLAALIPSMSKWTKKELLCNARGLDDGYVYVHSSHPLSNKLSAVLESSKNDEPTKTRLTDSAGLSGSIRLPLSNEVYPVAEDVTIPPPSSAVKMVRASHDNLFSDPIEPNAATCVAFTEPAKLSHKSIMLPGAVPPPSKLTQGDRVIRRPRLNRGGGTIANMGVSNGASHQSGYGSMNIGSYERELAQRTGRGNQMFQAGTRAWGAMEPMQKRPRRQGYGQDAGHQQPYQPNPFNQPPSNGAQSNRPGQGYDRPPWQNQPRNYGGAQGYGAQPNVQQPSGSLQNRWQPPASSGSHQQRHQPSSGHQQQGQYSSAQYNDHQQGSYGGRHQQRRQAPPPPPPPPRQHGHSFRGYKQHTNQGQPHQQQRRGHAANRPSQQNQPPSRVNPNIMSNLRSQLASTLQHNRRSGGRGDGRG